MSFTIEHLRAIMPANAGRADAFIPFINDAMLKFAIVMARRQAAFIAQCAHESGELRYLREISDGSNYEGRADLGNFQPGDGHRYLGRGLLQVTGRTNYLAVGTALGLDLINHPELLEVPANACLSAAWFWKTHGLNELADTDSFGAITKRINGGYTGLDQRLSYWLRARKACAL